MGPEFIKTDFKNKIQNSENCQIYLLLLNSLKRTVFKNCLH
jgi:hypothetical protein